MRGIKLGLWLLLASVSAKAERSPAQARQLELFPNYPQIFQELTDERSNHRSGPSGTQATLESDRVRLFQELSTPNFHSPTQHTRLLPPKGYPGYSDLHISVTHPYYEKGQLTLPGDLVAEWVNFLKRAQHKIILNVFEFDLQAVADVLAQKRHAGLEVSVGIDDGSVKKPEVKKIFDFLQKNGVDVFAVNSVDLNHQKVSSIDWDTPDNSWVMFSSGNLTHSCLDPQGDLYDLGDRRPKDSIPNANHLIWMKSFVLANLVHFELSKTLSHTAPLRGAGYPSTGSYQVTGPGVNPETLEAYPTPSLVISFAPGGGIRNINKTLVADLLNRTEGPVRIIQFAFSSKDVGEALLNKAKKSFQETGKFDLLAVGDTPFAMQGWSQLLAMSDLKLIKESKTSKHYEDDSDSAWSKELTPSEIEQIRKDVFIAPKIYGTHHHKIDGQSYTDTAKVHHKILASGPFAILGTSFNLSANAEKNNEQILIFKDPYLVDAVDGMARYLSEQSGKTVYDEAQRRNTYYKGPSPSTQSSSSKLDDEIPESSIRD